MNFYEIRTSKLHRWQVYFGPFERHCLRADNKIAFTRWDQDSPRIESGYQHLLAWGFWNRWNLKSMGNGLLCICFRSHTSRSDFSPNVSHKRIIGFMFTICNLEKRVLSFLYLFYWMAPDIFYFWLTNWREQRRFPCLHVF